MRSESGEAGLRGHAGELVVDNSRPGVLRITLNRPAKKNALTPAMYDGLRAALDTAAQQADLHALVLTGAGDAFSAGGDVRRMAAATDDTSEQARIERLMQRSGIVQCLHDFPVPTLAVMRGSAIGAGLSMAMACDVRIADRSARLRTGFLRLGLSGDFGGHYFLPRAAGVGGAHELYLLDDTIDADRAHALGLLQRVVEPGELVDLEAGIVGRWCETAIFSLRQLKQNLREAPGRPLGEVLDMEARRHVACVLSPGHRAALTRLGFGATTEQPGGNRGNKVV